MRRFFYIPSMVAYADSYAMNLRSAASNHAWVANPPFKDATDGGISFWFRIDTALTGNGVFSLIGMGDAGSKVGANGKYIFICARRTTGFGNTGTYLDISLNTTGGSPLVRSGSTPLSAGVWYHAVFGSDGNIYLNGSLEAIQYWSGNQMATGWFGDFSAANKHFSIGALRIAGVSGSFASQTLNNFLYLPGRSFTSAEVAAIYAAGMGGDPALLGMYGSLSNQWNFEAQNGNDAIGSTHLTLVNSPAFVAP